MQHRVSIARSSDARIAVSKAMALIGGMERYVKAGQNVLIKPNCVIQQYVPGTVTSAGVVAAIAQLVQQVGAQPIIGENDLAYDPVAPGFKDSCACYYHDALAAIGLADKVPMVNLSADEMVAVEFPDARVFKSTLIARTVLNADCIIDVPVLKTHDQTQITLGIKNLKGCLPLAERRRSHSLGVEQAIVDLCNFLKPALVVIDATTAAEGMGPVGGTPVPLDLVLASESVLAADMVGAAVAGFEPREIRFLRLAVKSGMGPRNLDEIEVRGEPIVAVQRPLLRASTVVQEQYRSMGIEVIGRNVCSGCWAEFRHIYYSLGNQKDKLKGLTFALGQVAADDVPRQDKVIVLGKCAKAAAACGLYVPGCPPHHADIEKAACQAAGADAGKIDTYDH